MNEEKPCSAGHVIDKVTPAITDLYFANRTCDCKLLIFKLVPCGCPGTPHDELKPFPNDPANNNLNNGL